MRCVAKYNPDADVSPVAQYGFVDLREAALTNTIPSQMDGDDTQFNDIDDPSQIIGRPEDVFEGMRMASAIANKADSSGANEPKGE